MDINVDIPSSRVEEILKSKIDGTTYDKPPLSRVEALLMELDAGGGTMDYNSLENRPSLNGVTLREGLTSEDVDVESNYDITYDSEDENVVIQRAVPPN